MARGREEKGGGKQKASTSTAEGLEIASLVSEKEAEGLEMASLVSEGKGKKPLQTKSEEETSSESETDEEYLETDDDDDDVDDDYEDDYFVEGRFCNGLAAQLGNGGDINVLFETPSGFAIFGYDGIKLLKPNAMQDIWADFVTEYVAKRVVVLKEFKTFEDKLAAINHETGVSEALATMIQQYTAPLQKLAVGNDNYRDIIEKCLHIPCMSGPHVDELMWGLKIQMRCLVPGENSELIKEDRFPMSAGMTFLLNRHNFKVQPDMLVTKVIIEKAGFVFECDRCVNKHNDSLRSAAEHLKKISDIDTLSWDLMKLAAAFKMICFPEEKFEPAKWLFTRRQLKRLRDDAPKYKDKILKMPCLVVYNEMSWARELRFKMARVLLRLVKRAKEAYEAEQACEAASDHEICPDGKGIHPGTTPVIIDELTECVRDIILSAGRKERQVPPTQAPIISLERYTQISSHPLHRVNEPGILSMDIHSSKDIVATGGVDTNVVLFDRPSGQILCTLTGHSKKITSLKFVNQDELLLTGSADKTVRVWQGSEDRTYSCIHTLKNHTAEVEAVTVNSTQKHFVTASKDNSWCLYDISTGSCLAQVGKGSGQEGYTSASFHPDGLILGTGTTDAIVKLWDFRASVCYGVSNVVKMVGHVGPVTAMSFSNNGYFLATAALDGVKLWDIRKLRNFMTLSPYDSDTPTNAVEFDFTGSYLAVGGSDIRVYQVPNFMAEWNVTKTLPDLSGTGEVTCVKFGADATYIAVGSMDPNLRIFGIQSCQLAGRETTFC